MTLLWSFARQHFQALAAYRLDFWLRASSIPILMYGLRWVWIALYAARPEVFAITLPQMITYAVLSLAIRDLFFTGPPYYMARQVRTGAIDGDLLKPLDFHWHMLVRSTGEMLFRVCVLTLPGLLIGYLLFDLQLPTSPQNGLLFLVALLLGYLVNFHLEFLLGAVSLVTLDIHSIDWAFHATSRFFSGQMVPLWLFTGALGTMAQVLPFRSIFFIPLSIYNGTLSGSAVLAGFGFQMTWLAVLFLLSRWLWGRIQNRIVSQGG